MLSNFRNEKRTLIISLKFNAGHFSHLAALYSLLTDIGQTPILFINSKFNNLDTDDIYNKKNTLLLKDYKDCDIAIFMFPSHRNIYHILMLKFWNKSKIIYFFHEPIKNYREFYNENYSIAHIIKLSIINLISKFTLLISSYVILPSKTALSIYEKKYSQLNKNYLLIPLFFNDENNNNTLITNNKIFISYIGTIANDHAFDNFLNYVEYAIKNQLFPQYKFMIATSSSFTRNVKNRIKHFNNQNRIQIFEGRWLTNYEINQCYELSVVIWNAYNRSTQSGVLPKAFMFGAPVLGNINIHNEFIIDQKNGIYLKDNNNLHEITKALTEILNNIEFYSKNSRDTFLNIFYYKNHIKEFIKICNNE